MDGMSSFSTPSIYQQMRQRGAVPISHVPNGATTWQLPSGKTVTNDPSRTGTLGPIIKGLAIGGLGLGGLALASPFVASTLASALGSGAVAGGAGDAALAGGAGADALGAGAAASTIPESVAITPEIFGSNIGGYLGTEALSGALGPLGAVPGSSVAAGDIGLGGVPLGGAALPEQAIVTGALPGAETGLSTALLGGAAGAGLSNTVDAAGNPIEQVVIEAPRPESSSFTLGDVLAGAGTLGTALGGASATGFPEVGGVSGADIPDFVPITGRVTGGGVGGGGGGTWGGFDDWLDKQFKDFGWRDALGVAGLGLSATRSQKPLPGEAQIKTTAANLGAQGQALSNYLSTGTLPPGVTQGLHSAGEAAKASIRSRFASMGMSGSSSEAQALANVDTQTASEGIDIATKLLQTGIQESQLSAELYNLILNNALQKDQQLGSAIGNFAAALAGGVPGQQRRAA